LAFDPGSADVRTQYAYWFLRPLGRLQEARAEYRRVLETDPLSSFALFTIAESYFFEGRFPSIVEPASKGLEIDPGYWPPMTMLATAYAHMGQYEEANAWIRQALTLAAQDVTVRAIAAMPQALGGDIEPVWQLIAELESKTGLARVPGMLAALYDAIGDVDAAFRVAQEMIDQRSARVFWILAPSYGNLQRDPRYPALLRRLGLPA
jgi:tetratricopeptide (TPR) repeat protein